MESPNNLAYRRSILSFVKLLFLALSNVPLIRAAPTHLLRSIVEGVQEEPEPLPADDASLWVYMSVAVGLVLLGGAFAGLTIALMGQDEIYLQVIKTSGEGAEKKHAARVLRLLEKGKHWVLVTLLLGNVITNETLPIVLDRSLGGGWPAVLGSTVLIVIFGEIIPQSICVRYGLPIGAWMSPLVLILMYALSPVAWPTAKLLDRLLGEEHGTTYKKAGLKTLVTLHKTLGAVGEQLNADEVTIISAVLDLKEKPIGSIMTPMDDVFIMSADTILDEKTMDVILSAGYSRIPIHSPDNDSNFVGMLLVKILITYDPEDGKAVRDFALATLPETSPLTSCLDIVNFFQEGKSHMVLVSDFPGQNHGAIGVVTLEDVIEELIGEEIIDESDVFIDVHKAIRRTHMAPRFRVAKEKVPKGDVVVNPEAKAAEGEENLIDLESREGEQPPPHAAIKRLTTSEARSSEESRKEPSLLSSSPKRSSIGRRNSSAATGSDRDFRVRREQAPEMREHLKHLGPSNLASRPRQTRYNTIKIKPGGESFSEVASASAKNNGSAEPTSVLQMPPATSGGVGEGLLSSAGKDASDGVHAVQAGYGTIGSPPRHPGSPVKSMKSIQAVSQKAVSSSPRARSESRPDSSGSSSSRTRRSRAFSPVKKGTVRSGSITENIIEADGIKKVVLEMTSSSEEHPEQVSEGGEGNEEDRGAKGTRSEGEGASSGGGGKKKRRRKRKKASKKGEEEPLLEEDET